MPYYAGPHPLYYVKCGTGPGTGVFYTFDIGMRLHSGGFQRREKLVEVPYESQYIDASDGELKNSTVIVSGKMYDDTGDLLDERLHFIYQQLHATTTEFYVWREFVAGGRRRFFPVSKCKSAHWKVVDASPAWANVTLKFTVVRPGEVELEAPPP